MTLVRTLMLLALVAGLHAAPASATSGAAGPGAERGQLRWACLVGPLTHGTEWSVLLPERTVDRLVEHTKSYRGTCAEYGEQAALGDGHIRAYSQVVGSRPTAIGMVMSDDTLEELPHDPPTEGKWCFDKDGDGTVDPMMECAGGYENQLDLGQRFRDRIDTPYTYVLSNWNPHGHHPPGVFDLPHFDVHFYVEPDAKRTAIRPGPCPALVNCDDYERAKRLPEPRYLAPDYADKDSIHPGMGNHLIDPTAPEFHGKRFTRTWIYGSYDRKITFYEAMVTHEWLDGMRSGAREDGCLRLKLPQKWQESGWYPTKYCIRHRGNRGELTVSMEGFRYRRAG